MVCVCVRVCCVHARACLCLYVYIYGFLFFFLPSDWFAFVTIVCLIIWFLERERGWMGGEVERVSKELGGKA